MLHNVTVLTKYLGLNKCIKYTIRVSFYSGWLTKKMKLSPYEKYKNIFFKIG